MRLNHRKRHIESHSASRKKGKILYIQLPHLGIFDRTTIYVMFAL